MDMYFTRIKITEIEIYGYWKMGIDFQMISKGLPFPPKTLERGRSSVRVGKKQTNKKDQQIYVKW